MEDYLYKLYLPMNLQFFADGPGGEKTEDATSKHLSDARKEGQVAKSQELITAVMLFMFFIALKIFVGIAVLIVMMLFLPSISELIFDKIMEMVKLAVANLMG